jgi:hypothetical protein
MSGLNPKQQQFIMAPQPTKVLVAGRGFGKSFVAGAQSAIRAAGIKKGKSWLFKPMARAKYAYVGPTMTHVKKNLLPSFVSGIKSMGFVEHIEGKQQGHFVVCKVPPKSWAKPFAAPEVFTEMITFLNGYTIQLVGLTDADSIRGVSFDGADVDEAAMVDREDFTKIILPTIRGNNVVFLNHSLHQQVCLYTSMPWLNSGAWVLEYEKLATQSPNEYFFLKGTSWDNVEVLGRKTLMRWQKDMPPLDYKVEIMCEAVDKVGNAYYSDYDEKRHTYLLPIGNYSDVDLDQELHVSFDFNGNFLCCLVAQVYQDEIRILAEVFTKGANLIDSLITLLANTFNNHRRKVFVIYGDKMGNSRLSNINSNTVSYYEDITRRLGQLGWQSRITNIGTNALHIRRHDVINKALTEAVKGCPRIRINKRRCIFTVNSLPRVGMLVDFEKDKRSERDANCPPEQATHLSDCFDYLVYRLCEKAVEGRKTNVMVGW